MCCHCPEALQIQAVMPKCGQGGRRTREGDWTVQQVTFNPPHHNTYNPASTTPLQPTKASSAITYVCVSWEE
ncbi:MAG: hypothetical protein ATN32_04845 [Candidatus Epulonipiscium fishelsonii]|nr:MAG: hypothetical protein ATN32_04845 [Epulopiscium sp. AS2M-Bin002]